MALPNPSMVFVPFDILTAEELNQMVENDQALAAGTGLDDDAVGPEKRSGGFKTGIINVATTGIKTITAPGFRPKCVKIYGTVTSSNALNASSVYTYDGTGTGDCFATVSGSGGDYSRYYNNFAIINTAPTQVVVVADVTITDTGFTCNVSIAASTVTVWYEVNA